MAEGTGILGHMPSCSYALISPVDVAIAAESEIMLFKHLIEMK